jgi:predicted DNA-binding antitoxin AbrB/MazE fold protein
MLGNQLTAGLYPIHQKNSRYNTMTEIIEATFDGKVFLPDQPVRLRANTHVKIRIESEMASETAKQKSFLGTARSLNLNGPEDWSENIDHYLNDDLLRHG